MANKTVTVRSSGGDYTSLNAALAGEASANPNLVTGLDGILTIDCAGFEDATSALTGEGWTTDSSHYINIVGDNMTGKASTTAYRLNVAASTGLAIGAAYTRVSYVEISVANPSSWSETQGIRGGDGTNHSYATVVGCVVHDVHDANSVEGFGIYHLPRGTIRNNVVYNTHRFGIFSYDWVPPVLVENNTVYNCAVDADSGMRIDESSSSSRTRNNLVIGSATCYAIASGNTKATNGSSDTTGTAGLQSLVAADIFTSVTPGSIDLSLKSTSGITNVGTDLSATFTTDITGATRPTGTGTWSIGAFQWFAPSIQSVYPTADVSVGGWTSHTG